MSALAACTALPTSALVVWALLRSPLAARLVANPSADRWHEKPTPLHRPIACRGRLARRDGRKLFIEGELVDLETEGQPVVARGKGLFIAVDPSVFDVGTQQLPAPPDED